MDDTRLIETGSSFLAFTADETEFAAAIAKFLDKTILLDRRHKGKAADLSAKDRRSFGDMGWLGLLAPETAGGSGLTAIEHALFFREVGRRCGPVDILAHVLAAKIAADNSSASLSSLIAGEVGVALAVKDGLDFRILGNPDAAFVLSAEPDQARLWDISRLRMEMRPSLDPLTTMRVASGPLPKASVAVQGPQLWKLGELGCAAMLIGVAEVSLEMIVEYANIRETFGRKIGSYQAVRHPCADMALRAELARAQLWYAAAAVTDAKGDADTHLNAAKHLANNAALVNADVNIQLHGGIGVTDEHHAHLLLKRSLLLSQVFGTKRGLLARLLHAGVQD